MKSAVIIYKNEPYLFEEKRFAKIDIKKSRYYRVGSVLLLKYVIAYTFKLPMNLSQEQLDVQVELKMYQEGGLDPNIDYVIDYISYKIEHENIYLIEAFAVKKEDLSTLFGEIVKKIGFIDIIFPKFIAYKALYPKEFTVEENHLFFSLSQEESFAAIYKNGEYIGYRQIDSLGTIAKNLGYELSFLRETLIKKGLKQENYTPEEMHIYTAISEIFYKNVEKVVYAINFKRSYFGLDRIDRLIIDFEGEEIDGLRDMFLSFGVEGDYLYQKLQCCELEPKSSNLALLALYVVSYDELDQQLNFTVFERKRPIYQFEVFQYILLFILVLFLSSGVWGYYLYQTKIVEDRILSLQSIYNKLRKKNKRYLQFIEKLKKDRKKVEEEKESLLQEIWIYQETLNAIPFFEQVKLDREKMINDVIEALYRYKLSTKSIKQNGTKSVIVDIVSKSDERERIAKFMESLLKKGYKNIETNKIVRSKDYYESVIKVTR